jgi:hyperosmotically inducible protein
MKTKFAYAQSAALSLALMASIGMAPIGDTMAGERTAGEVVDDVSIAAQTKAGLAADPVTDAIKIDVEVDKSHVQLNGFVDSMEERTRAEEIVRGIKGVASVDNNLQLQPRDRTAGEYVDDKILVAEVKAALAEDPVAHTLKIDIEADQGVISLGGHVDTAAEKEAAYNAAKQVAGVVKVVNNLDVRS